MARLEQRLRKLFASQLPFYSCSDYYVSYEFLTIKNKMLKRFKDNDFSKEMIQYVNGFSKNNYTCDYFTEEKFKALFNNHQKNPMKAFHVNIGSFDPKSFELAVYLRSLKHSFQIIALTEIGQTSKEFIEFIFPEYEIYMVEAPSTRGGVALLVLKNTFKNIISLEYNDVYSFDNMCNCSNCLIESCFITLETSTNKFTIGCIYRHPNGEINHFNEQFRKIINSIDKTNITIIMGDVNIDLLQPNNCKHEAYLNLCLEFNFVPCITLPTRITDHSATLLDHILVRTPSRLMQNKVSAGNLICGLSDHLPNFIVMDINTYTFQDRPKIRLFTENNINNFLSNMEDEVEVFNENNEENNSEIPFTNFHNKYVYLFNKYFPLIRMSRKQFKHKPYITRGILVSIHHKSKLLKKYLEHNTPINELNYKRFRNKLVNVIKRSEENYHRSLISENNNNNRQLWKCFGKMLNKKKIKHSRITSLVVGPSQTNNQQQIVEEFNEFFSNIGRKLAKNIDNSNIDFKTYMDSPQPQSILLGKTNETEIINIINKMKDNKSPGYDSINAKFLKISSPFIAPILSKIFNSMLKSGLYPDELKVAKVIPIYKNGDATKCTNYRPISILSLLNNIFEKLLYKRLYEYLEKFKILYQFQYGFRKGHSTIHALVELVDKIRNSIDNGEMTCGIFVDLSKAFDTVDHKILLHKLDHYGFRGKTNKLLESYLSNRKQYVEINNVKSKYKQITCGVPQGSVLGPLLFLIYINDLPNSCPSGNSRIFADDTTVFFTAKNRDEILRKGQIIMAQMNSWFIANKLTLNTSKSSFIVFRSRYSRINNLPNKFEFAKSEIIRSNTIKYLGLTLDEHLIFNQHVQNVCNSIKRYFKIFYNIRRYLNNKQIEILYYSMIYSRIKYGLIVYGFATKTNLKKIQTLQNQLMKVLTSRDYRFSTNDLHTKHNILKVEDIFLLEKISFVHNFVNNKLPPMFKDYYTKFSQIHTIETRNSNSNFIVPFSHSNFGSYSMKIEGAKVWNDLDTQLKQLTNMKRFRSKAKEKLMQYH